MKKNLKNSTPESFTVLSGLARKINAPLKSLLLSSQTLLDTYKQRNFEYISFNDFKHMIVTLERMNKQIKQCYETTQRLIVLDQSNIKHESCDINKIIGDILELLKNQFVDYKIKSSVRLKKGVPLVYLSRIDAHQVMQNIIANAIQAMPAGGLVKIRTLYDEKQKFVIVEISDEGVGIDPQHLPKVFEPFFTTKDHGVEKTSGLGLSIVYAIVQAAGGSITIQSSLRKGTQVRIFLPAITV